MAKKNSTEDIAQNENTVATVPKTLWDTALPQDVGAKRISQVPIVNTREMPVGSAVSGRIIGFSQGPDETIKTPLIDMVKSDGTEFRFPLSTVIETALTQEFGKEYMADSVDHTIWIKKTSEKESKRHRERHYNVFEIYIKK